MLNLKRMYGLWKLLFSTSLVVYVWHNQKLVEKQKIEVDYHKAQKINNLIIVYEGNSWIWSSYIFGNEPSL